MKSSELYQWMSDTSLLNKSTLAELKQMVDEYPYFQAVKMLYLKNLSILEDVRLDKELKRMAIHIPDRRRLFLLINNAGSSDKASTPPKTARTPAETPANAPVNISDYTSWMEDNIPDLPVTEREKDEEKQRKEMLVDEFMKNENSLRIFNPAQAANGSATVERSSLPPSSDSVGEQSIEEASIDNSFFTETLARVYLKQKRYDKALEIFLDLRVKHPEKNIYYDDRIRYLEKIININK
ncbi:MAG: hypothetical protein LBD53_10685 [Tannerella sp.]|jgi:hypothetical protein|nr:hypothetical protein [Tannerella sp.]